MDHIAGLFLGQLQTLQDNQFFHGGLVLGILSALAVWGRRIPALLLGFLRRRLVVEVEILKANYAYDALLAWWSRQPGSLKNRRFVLKTCKDNAPKVEQEAPPEVELIAAPGNHFLWHGGRPLWLSLTREKLKGEHGLLLGYHEQLNLRSLGHDRGFLLDLLRQAVSEHWCREAESKVFVLKSDLYWEQLEGICPGRLDAVFLPAGQLERICADLSGFLSRRDWFRSKGIPWRRGYLFHGPPGTGKSKLCLALCSHFRLNLAVVSLTHHKIDDSSLAGILSEAPLGSAFLFEDIDRVIGHPGNEVTMAGLLSVLDGVVAQEGRIVFLTTNHLPQLDPALIRPGRIDLQEHLGFVTPDQARRFFCHFFPAAPEQAVIFARWAGDGRWTMAQLQDHLISHVDDPHTASRPSGKAIAVEKTLFAATPS
ncbi:MAG: AAA family ATPase [Candidatus Latescibacteria bacterium]|nr:AAA family ATPase [Candidatus Latescibacterota bacterium]